MNEIFFQIDKKNDYKALHSADVHTVTGILKAFFRDMKSNLIPMDTSKYLLNEISMLFKKIFSISHLLHSKFLGSVTDETLQSIRKNLQILDDVNYETLKFLMKHLSV